VHRHELHFNARWLVFPTFDREPVVGRDDPNLTWHHMPFIIPKAGADGNYGRSAVSDHHLARR
jgi:hypothetical protein